VNLELGLDNNTWYGITYKGGLNSGVSKVNDLRNTNLFVKHELELDFYTSSKSRLNLGLESVNTSTSSSDMTNRNTLFNLSYFYKPTKKLFLRASFTNIFNEDFFTTVQNSSNFISQSQFSLRPRQFTIGLNYSL
jgi:outer membrane receptor protein involved in Fe transport